MGGCSQTVSMRGVPITNWLLFCSSLFRCSGSRLALAWSAMWQIAQVEVRRKQYFVSTIESSPAVDLSC